MKSRRRALLGAIPFTAVSMGIVGVVYGQPLALWTLIGAGFGFAATLIFGLLYLLEDGLKKAGIDTRSELESNEAADNSVSYASYMARNAPAVLVIFAIVAALARAQGQSLHFIGEALLVMLFIAILLLSAWYYQGDR